MYLGIIPFVVCQGLTLLAVYLLPSTATWLPKISAGF
jgi:TRAP-type mannitol/chloroaromatic compound transport system permease large subunit